jgi:hypothetical protein
MFSKKTYVPSVFIARTATIFFCCLGVFISLQFKDLFSILLAFSNFYYPMAMIPYVILTLRLNFKKASIMSGIFSGILVTVVNYILTKIFYRINCSLGWFICNRIIPKNEK